MRVSVFCIARIEDRAPARAVDGQFLIVVELVGDDNDDDGITLAIV